jgi:hypothetical protein
LTFDRVAGFIFLPKKKPQRRSFLTWKENAFVALLNDLVNTVSARYPDTGSAEKHMYFYFSLLNIDDQTASAALLALFNI